MNAQFMSINPRELVIDMPLDDKNVQVKMSSLQQIGMVQPVTIWLEGNRIIDGFHRVAAACLLEWPEIDVWVRDCDEEAFWDARIQSARQHHSISDQRLVAWIVECWKATKWYQAIRQTDDEELPSERPGKTYNGKPVLIPSEEAKELAEALWLVEKVLPDDIKKRKHALIYKKLPPGQRELLDWFVAKAEQWQLGYDELRVVVYGVFGYVRDSKVDAAAKRHDMSFDQRNIVYGQYVGRPGTNAQSIHASDIKSVDKALSKPTTDEKFNQVTKKPVVKSKVEGLLPDTSALDKEVADAIDAAADMILRLENKCKHVPGSAALLVELMHTVNDMIERVWPTYKGVLSKVSPLAAENRALRAEIAQMKTEVESYKRALHSKEISDALITSTYAYSSTEISKKGDAL